MELSTLLAVVMDKNNEDKSDEMECFRNYTALLNYCHKTEPCPRVECLYSLEYCSWSAYTNSLTYAFLNYCIDGSPSSEIKNIYWNVVYFFYQIHTLMAFYLKKYKILMPVMDEPSNFNVILSFVTIYLLLLLNPPRLIVVRQEKVAMTMKEVKNQELCIRVQMTAGDME